MTNETTAITLADYMRQPDHLARFVDLLGRDGASYVQSVLIAVSGSETLMKCTHQSILRSALRAASLGLSCDPALKQAWLVPYNRRIKNKDGTESWVSEAQFQPHYKGLYTLAMRTNKYWQINVSPIYDGQRVLENTLTGLHFVQESNGLIGQPASMNPAYTDVTTRRKKDKKVIGWLGYFKTKQGFEKSVYMSVEEIGDHARQYVKEYEKNPNWSNPDKRPVMEMKTVLRQLLSWADLSGTENAPLQEAMQADTEPETIDAETESEPVGMTYDQAKQITVKGKGGKEKFVGELDAESLNAILISDKFGPEQKEAAQVVLQHDFNMEPPAESKSQKAAQGMKDLGF